MPYVTCPGCRVSSYSAASHTSIVDSCPVCGTSLELLVSNSPRHSDASNGVIELDREAARAALRAARDAR